MNDLHGNCGLGGREIANRTQRMRKRGRMSRWERGALPAVRVEMKPGGR